MTPEQIKILFEEAIQEKAVYNKLEGISRNLIYNWNNNRGAKPTVGDMINVLYQLNLIEIIDSCGIYAKMPNIGDVAYFFGEPQPEIIEDRNGKKRTLAPSTRPNSNSK